MRARTNHYALIALAMAGAAAGSACGHTPADPPSTQATPPAQAAAATPLSTAQTRVPGQYLVTLAPGAHSQVIADMFRRFGVKSITDVMAGVFLLTVSEDPGPEQMEALRKQDARIKAIQPNFIYGPAGGTRAQ